MSVDALSRPHLNPPYGAGAADPEPWGRGLTRQARWIDATSVLRPRRKPEPPPAATFMVESAFFAVATHDNKFTHVAALNAGSHWLLCSAREPAIRLAAGQDIRSARQFATINDAYRYARTLAPAALKFDIR
jgi:hypothetical protein